jgi:hypothetical protein
MTTDEKDALLNELVAGRDKLLEAVAGVTEDLAVRIPAERKWSIRDCVEHLVMAEENLMGRVRASQPADAQIGSPEREARILARGADRSRTVQAPETAQPCGRFSTLTEAADQFGAVRAQTLRFLESCREDLRLKVAAHPILGPVNCYEMLLMIAMHPRRHANQIEEIKAALSAP